MTKIDEFGSEADIFPLSPCRAGKKIDSMRPGFLKPSFGAMSRVRRK